MNTQQQRDNPFFRPWTGPGEVPPFAEIRPEHFPPAYARAFAEHEAEVAAIAGRPETPDFTNTIAAIELSGRALARVEQVFHLLAGAHSNDALLEIERELSPQVASHWHKFHTNPELFRRAGAAHDGEAKKRLAEIVERLAELGTAFSQNVLADEQSFALSLHDEAELAGLPAFMRDAMKSEAEERGLKGHVVTLSRSSAEPFLEFAQRRDLREKVYRAFVSRGDNGGKTDNKAIIAEMVRLRAERARLLGYNDFAHYRLDDAMAKTPGAVRNLLDTVWAPARASALADHDR